MNRDVQFMETPIKWPRWPCLPLKRRVNEENQHGFLLAQEGMRSTVHLGSVFIAERVNKAARYEGDLITYPSFQAIVEDGWVVD